jgi:hypothetical protein
MPDERTEKGFQEWKEGMRELAALPNVAAKISGLGMTDHHWTVESIRPYVITTIQCKRCTATTINQLHSKTIIVTLFFSVWC